jgi:hypothetical protein
MTVSFDLPSDIENTLRGHGLDPAQALKEAALVELYRRSEIAHHQLADAMGLTRLETEALLKRHDVPLDQTVDDLLSELESLRAGKAR